MRQSIVYNTGGGYDWHLYRIQPSLVLIYVPLEEHHALLKTDRMADLQDVAEYILDMEPEEQNKLFRNETPEINIEKRFHCYWNPKKYEGRNNLETGFFYFIDTNGYTPEDIREIHNLEPGQVYVFDNGHAYVRRIK